jgi:hypothetical protein
VWLSILGTKGSYYRRGWAQERRWIPVPDRILVASV